MYNMLPHAKRIEHRGVNRKFLKSLLYVTHVIDGIARDTVMYQTPYEPYQWQRTIMGHTFSVSRPAYYDHGEGTSSLMTTLKGWFGEHEEAQVMLASVLVVVGLWWLVRTILALLINLICPLLVVLLAVLLVPQLRTPLLGQNYPAVANVMSNILMKLGENIRPNNC